MIKPDIVAPGVSICAAELSNWLSDRRCLDTQHIAISGTSMATPHISGAAALLLQKDPNLTPEEIKAILKSSTINLGYNENYQGTGRIDILNAVRLDKELCTLNGDEDDDGHHP